MTVIKVPNAMYSSVCMLCGLYYYTIIFFKDSFKVSQIRFWWKPNHRR
eukprot:SAG22_NODE_601_length_8666_cov_7.089413_7_plen_48_part_00